jgi:hypothetical protein
MFNGYINAFPAWVAFLLPGNLLFCIDIGDKVENEGGFNENFLDIIIKSRCLFRVC